MSQVLYLQQIEYLIFTLFVSRLGNYISVIPNLLRFSFHSSSLRLLFPQASCTNNDWMKPWPANVLLMGGFLETRSGSTVLLSIIFRVYCSLDAVQGAGKNITRWRRLRRYCLRNWSLVAIFLDYLSGANVWAWYKLLQRRALWDDVCCFCLGL